MSSLVDYGSSDESENEDVDEDDVPANDIELSHLQSYNRREDTLPSKEVNAKSDLFSTLPSPKKSACSLSLDADQDRLIDHNHKNIQKKQPVKITIPSLSEFKDEEESEPAKKKLKPSLKGSGLFSILPAPKNVIVKEAKRSLVPHVLTKKPPSNNQARNKPLALVSKSEDTKSLKKDSSLISYADSEEEESDGEGDFFSLKTEHETEIKLNHLNSSKAVTDIVEDENPTINDTVTNKNEDISEQNDEPLAFNSKFNPSPWLSGTSRTGSVELGNWQKEMEPSTSQPATDSSDDYISVKHDDLELNDEALQRLCGRRAKRQQQDMQLIEVSGDAIMPDPKEWLTKQLTQEQETKIHSHRRNDGPTTQQRRKHQITYLAFQAKENELELKNQWSQNRMSRKQTQSKYGF